MTVDKDDDRTYQTMTATVFDRYPVLHGNSSCVGCKWSEFRSRSR
ncbi:hypothetical protein [Chamaesiphon sp.]